MLVWLVYITFVHVTRVCILPPSLGPWPRGYRYFGIEFVCITRKYFVTLVLVRELRGCEKNITREYESRRYTHLVRTATPLRYPSKNPFFEQPAMPENPSIFFCLSFGMSYTIYYTMNILPHGVHELRCRKVLVGGST